MTQSESKLFLQLKMHHQSMLYKEAFILCLPHRDAGMERLDKDYLCVCVCVCMCVYTVKQESTAMLASLWGFT